MAVHIPSDFEAEVRIFLDLAENPQFDVATTTEYGSLAVVVPDELMDRYRRYHQVSESSPPKEPKKKGSTL